MKKTEASEVDEEVKPCIVHTNLIIRHKFSSKFLWVEVKFSYAKDGDKSEYENK